MNEQNKKLIEWITSGVISVFLANLGIKLIDENISIAIITILISFVLLYSTYYALEIKGYIEKNKKFEKWVEEKEELLNTLKDIIILKKVSKIK